MSARAAARLEDMGFTRVYDYVGGKKDWLIADLPVEGQRAGQPLSGDLARRDAPTCRPDDAPGDVIDRSGMEGWGFCVVTDDDNVVHGLLAKGDIPDRADGHVVQDVMQLGPVTIRPSRSLESAVRRMDQLDTDSVLVTTDFGELLGVLYREDAQNHLAPVGE